MSTIKGVVSCLQNIGIYMDDSMDQSEDLLQSLKLDKLENYIEDSIAFITFIVEVEQTFNIEVTDEYLLPSRLETLDDVCRMITALKTDS